MPDGRSLALLLALSLLAPAFLAGAQAQEGGNETETTNETDEDAGTPEDGSEADDGVECWEDHEGPACDAVADTREAAWDLMEAAEADGELPFRLDDPYVDCHEEEWDGEARLICTSVDSLVECWEDRGEAGCEAIAGTREAARERMETAQANGELPFRLDDPYVECHAEDWDDEVGLMCSQVEHLVECWDDRSGPVCEAVGQTPEEAYAKFDQEEAELPFHPDDADVRCDEETWENQVAIVCSRERQHEDRHRDGGAHEGDPAPGPQPECTPLPDEGVVECVPPPECEGRLGETPECTPPSECEVLDADLVRCPLEAMDAGRDQAAPPDCRAHPSDPRALVCTPPPECEGKIGETAACTPPPECEDNGDGTFTCTPPEDARPAPAAGDARSEPGREAREEGSGNGLSPEVRDELQAAIQEALGGFREELDSLRTQYEEGKTELAERYEETKDELREDYRACLATLDDDAERVDVLEHELACKQEARGALQAEREVLLAERDLLREDLLSQAKTAQFHTCSTLQDTLHGILMDEGIFESGLGSHLGPEDLGLCSGVLLDFEGSGDLSSTGWGGEEGGGLR